MNKTLMLEQLINHYTKGNKAQFANMLGITPQLVSNWISRNSFDAEILYTKCVGVSASWLLSGEGDMLTEPNTQNDNIQNDELIALCKQLIANYQQRDNIIDKLVSMTNIK